MHSRSIYIYSSTLHTFLNMEVCVYTILYEYLYSELCKHVLWTIYISTLYKQVCAYTRYSFIRVCIYTICIHDNRQNVEVAVICAHPPIEVVGEVLLLSAVLHHRGLAVGYRSSFPFMPGGSMKFRGSCNLSTK